jgi:hypothetical protein
MRYLHVVGAHEKFVASGVYVHYQDGEATGTLEHWSIHELPDGAQIMRVDDDWRDVDGSSVLIEAWRSRPGDGGRIERFDVSAFGARGAAVQRVRATFSFTGDHLDVGHSIDDTPRRQLEMQLPPGYIVAPEGLIFGGFEAAELARYPGEEQPVVSYLPTFLTAEAAFRPVVHRQRVEIGAADEVIELGGKSYPAHRLHQHSSLAPEVLTIWTDRHNVLLKYHVDDQRHSAVLTHYARRPDPKPRQS